ncbi:ATP synthase subunit b [bioreactor metagenome]|jgi:ATP synthase, F0 subunit b|uniref:ATP synthase subunit b n=1 Tax=bioreactor metagenome TaxID=1076179 RepID=A0A644UCF2_9ZZZZ|nr:F0F1 ATP synthase subunit B [Acidaminococcaceae bacterium]NLU44392.1 F0F1 ATP synthase subunit B [Acholeplasmataceae bacterium]
MTDINATLIAQILNFIVLLWVLAKFAYKPLIKAMDDRRNRIINDLDSAEQTRLDAEALKAQYVEQMANARQEATEIVDKANKVAQNLHDEFMEQARAEKDAMMATAKERIEQDKKQALVDIRTQVIALSTQIASKVANQKLNSAEDQKLVAEATDKVLGNR